MDDLTEYDVLGQIGDDVETVEADLLVGKVHEKTDDYVDYLKALDEMVLVLLDEAQVPND